MVKIGAELPKLSPNKTGYPFLDHPICMTSTNSPWIAVLTVCDF